MSAAIPGAARARETVTAIRSALLLALAAAALLALLLLAAGQPVGPALAALLRGAVGSPDAFLSGTLVRATPLLLTGLAVAIAFRGGVLNIGAEGQLLAGAALATALAPVAAAAPRPIAVTALLLAGAAAGAAWAAIAALLRARFAVAEVISTLMLNFVALNLVGWLVRGPLQEPTRLYPQSANLPDATRIPALVPGSRLHAGFLLALLLAALAAWVVARTAAGFRLRVTGANPEAARSAGLVRVGRVTAGAFVASGALAGLAGATELGGVTYALYENLSPGYGYTAIAVALLARLSPALVVPSALFFGALEAGAGAMQRDAGVPSTLVTVVEAALILVALAAGRIRIATTSRRPSTPATSTPG